MPNEIWSATTTGPADPGVAPEGSGARDLAALLADRPDIARLVEQLAAAEPAAVERLLKAATKRLPAPDALPPVNADFLDLFSNLPPEVERVRRRLREFMEQEVAPIADDYWERAEFPHHLLPKLAGLGVIEAIYPEAPDGR